MSLQLTGTLHHIGTTETISDKFQKRSFVLKITDGKYDEHPQLEITQDKCSLLDKFKIGQEVTVSFNVRGKEYTSKKTGEISYFTSLQAWRIEAQASHGESATGGTYEAQNDNRFAVSGDEPDELPF